MVCTYRVCAGAQAQFEELLARHVLTLRPLELITDFPAQTMRRVDADEPEYIEVFEWVSDDAATGASEMSEGIEIWEPMAALCESRHGRSGLEFPLFDRVRPHC